MFKTLEVANNLLGSIGFLKELDLLGGQLHMQPTHEILEVLDIRDADYRGGHVGLGDQPCYGHLRVGDGLVLSNLLHPLYDLIIHSVLGEPSVIVEYGLGVMAMIYRCSTS